MPSVNLPAESASALRCPNCSATPIGAYCHECGQKRIQARLTLRELFGDITRRVFRYDKALLHTFWRAVRAPGVLAEDYLAGRRRGILDPVQYYISSVFVQFLVVVLTRSLAPLMDRMSALNWLGVIGGIVATRILVVFVVGALWQGLFRPKRHNLAEYYVFSLYAFATIGILWALLPLLDLIVPAALGESPNVVAAVCIALEAGYIVHGVRDYSDLPVATAALRVALVFALTYGALYLLGGSSDWYEYLIPPLPRP